MELPGKGLAARMEGQRAVTRVPAVTAHRTSPALRPQCARPGDACGREGAGRSRDQRSLKGVLYPEASGALLCFVFDAFPLYNQLRIPSPH